MNNNNKSSYKEKSNNIEDEVIRLINEGTCRKDISTILDISIEKIKYIRKKRKLDIKNKRISLTIENINHFLANNFPYLFALDLEIEKRDNLNYKYWITIQCSECSEVFRVGWENLKRKNTDGSFRFKGCYNCGNRKNTLIRYDYCNCCGEKILKKDALKRGEISKLRYYCSDKCFKENESIHCSICNKKFLPKYSNKTICSDKCREGAYKIRIKNQSLKNETNFKSEIKICKNCGEEFETEYKGLREFCSERCRKRKYKEQDKIRTRRMQENGEVDKDITLDKVFKKYDGECQICKRKCNYNDFGENINGHVIYGNAYPSIDHIVPISKGGTHTWGNIQLACRLCNSYKCDSYVEEREGQLRLF